MMVTINEKIEKNVLIIENTILSGMIVGDVVVKEMINFEVNGMISGNVLVSKDANVIINGTVNGNIRNSGGHLEILGTINGNLEEIDGITIIDKDAVINKR